MSRKKTHDPSIRALRIAHVKKCPAAYAALMRARAEHPVQQQRPAGAVHHVCSMYPK